LSESIKILQKQILWVMSALLGRFVPTLRDEEGMIMIDGIYRLKHRTQHICVEVVNH